ncbi:unnamed protein product, partial [Pylaiella littoralis]
MDLTTSPPHEQKRWGPWPQGHPSLQVLQHRDRALRGAIRARRRRIQWRRRRRCRRRRWWCRWFR